MPHLPVQELGIAHIIWLDGHQSELRKNDGYTDGHPVGRRPIHSMSVKPSALSR